MDKTKINNIYLLLLVLVILPNMQSYSQEIYTKELFWVKNDSVETISFQGKEQLIEWGKHQLPLNNSVKNK